MKIILGISTFIFVSLGAMEAPTPLGSPWVQPLGQDSGVVFFQGADNSLAQAAMYMVGSEFTTPNTQEIVRCTKGITIFKNVCVDPELPEVEVAFRESNWIYDCLHPVRVLEESNSRKQYASSGFEFKSHINSSQLFTVSAFSIDRKKVTLGQMPDVLVQQQRAANFVVRYGNMPQIWHGLSRGAAVTAIAAALANKQNPDSLKTVKAIFLEGCYASVESDMHTLTNSQIAISCANAYFSWWYAYQKNGINFWDVIKHFPKHITTLLITSKTDAQVPKAETDKIVSTLVNDGHEKIYYLILENSSHGNYVASNPQDAQMYQALSHALFKELYLPYLPAYAVAGAPLLAMAKKNAQAFKKNSV
jgi:hypothetical protein